MPLPSAAIGTVAERFLYDDAKPGSCFRPLRERMARVAAQDLRPPHCQVARSCVESDEAWDRGQLFD